MAVNVYASDYTVVDGCVLTLADTRVRAGALEGMKEIAAALRAGDAPRAGRAMLNQLERARHALVDRTNIETPTMTGG